MADMDRSTYIRSIAMQTMRLQSIINYGIFLFELQAALWSTIGARSDH